MGRAEEVVELEKTNHFFDQPSPKLPTSLPTSVIVTSRPPGPKPVTQSLFRKEREKTIELPVSKTKIITQSLFVKERRNAIEPIPFEPPKPPKVATAKIFGADKVEEKKRPTVTTSKFFVPSQSEADQVKAQPESTSKKTSEQQSPPVGSCDASKEYLEEERKFFEMLFNFDTSNLEQLAPHNGVDCVDLKIPSKAPADNQFDRCEQNCTRGDDIKSEEYNDLLGSVIDLNAIENFRGLMTDWSPSEPPPASSASSEENWSGSGTRFDLTETPLLRPEEDIMWGMESSQNVEDSEQKVIWGDVTKKDGRGGGRSRKEPPCHQKRKTFCSEASGEPPKKVRVVHNTSDYLL